MIFSNDSYYWSEFSQIIQKMNARWTISFISQANTSKLYDVGLPHLCFLFSRFFKHVERYDSGFYSPGTVSPAWCSYLSLPAGISARQIERSKSGTKKIYDPRVREISLFSGDAIGQPEIWGKIEIQYGSATRVGLANRVSAGFTNHSETLNFTNSRTERTLWHTRNWCYRYWLVLRQPGFKLLELSFAMAG